MVLGGQASAWLVFRELMGHVTLELKLRPAQQYINSRTTRGPENYIKLLDSVVSLLSPLSLSPCFLNPEEQVVPSMTQRWNSAAFKQNLIFFVYLGRVLKYKSFTFTANIIMCVCVCVWCVCVCVCLCVSVCVCLQGSPSPHPAPLGKRCFLVQEFLCDACLILLFESVYWL